MPLEARVPTSRLNGDGIWKPHFPNCAGIDKAHRLFAEDVLAGPVPSMRRDFDEEDMPNEEEPDEAA